MIAMFLFVVVSLLSISHVGSVANTAECYRSEEILDCRGGGIQYFSGEIDLSISRVLMNYIMKSEQIQNVRVEATCVFELSMSKLCDTVEGKIIVVNREECLSYDTAIETHTSRVEELTPTEKISLASKLYHIINADGKKIDYHKIKRWLNAQDNYSLQKTPRRSFKRLRVYTTGIGTLMDVDLMQVSNLSQWNSGYNFILVAIDCFSRRLWMQESKSKKGVDIAKAFGKILQSAKVDKIRSDVDGCFKSKVVQKLFKER
ncbi:unnamed protein product [Mytilus coruscus]|uniref:Integrase catalytic domain-containing protein n=1 Tax=Mytilus coruscus TaxID=42192 RepID=A0A6J8ESW3_MYTCO|nr:unnamed protein product [Mytilus coruscus]